MTEEGPDHLEALTAACLEYLTLLSSSGEGGTAETLEGLLPLPGGSPKVILPSHQIVCGRGGSGGFSVKTSVNGGGVMMCLASVLESLSDCDERCVFSVRKINKLGFKSHSALKKYFSQFGNVVAIFFLPYRYKPDTSSVRPSSMAFIRMDKPDAVEAIFNFGNVHYIHGWPVTVQVFKRATAASDAAEKPTGTIIGTLSGALTFARPNDVTTE
jgi:hypothetical protein